MEPTETGWVPPTPLHLMPFNEQEYGTPNSNQALDSGVIDDIERENDQIRDAREDLLGFRFRLKEHRGELRDLRQKTGVEEGAIVSQLRKIFQDRDTELPIELENAFTRVIALRDIMGSLEGKYEEEEDKYDDVEWKYAQKEANFVARLTSKVDIPSTEGRNVEIDSQSFDTFRLAETGMIPMEFLELRPDTINFATFQNQPYHEPGEGMSQSLEQRTPSTPTVEKWPISSHLEHVSAQFADTFSPLSQAYNETALSEAHLAWNNSRERIDVWIIDTVSCSKYSQFMLEGLLSFDDLTHYWSSDSASTPPLGMNTLDSCISSETANPLIGIEPLSVLSGKANTARPDMETEMKSYTRPDAVGAARIRSTHSTVTGKINDRLDMVQAHPRRGADDVEWSGIASNAILQPVDEQKRKSCPPALITSTEKGPAEHDECISASLLNNQQPEEGNDSPKIISNENKDEKCGILVKNLYHFRRISNPESRRPIPTVYQPRHHEDPSTTTRPYYLRTNVSRALYSSSKATSPYRSNGDHGQSACREHAHRLPDTFNEDLGALVLE